MTAFNWVASHENRFHVVKVGNLEAHVSQIHGSIRIYEVLPNGKKKIKQGSEGFFDVSVELLKQWAERDIESILNPDDDEWADLESKEQ